MDKEKLIRKKKIFPVIIVGGIIGIMVLFFLAGLSEQVILVVLAAITLPIFAIGAVYYYNNKILGPFKDLVIKDKLVKSIPGIKYEYKPDTSSLENMCKSLCLIPAATSYKFYDEITDFNHDYVYKSLDLHATHSSGKSTITDFRGKAYIVEEFNYGCEFILADLYFFNRFRLNRFIRANSSYKDIIFNSKEFNLKFKLISKDEILIHKIFNPAMLSKLTKHSDITGNIVINYYQGKLYIFIHNNEDQFEQENDVVADYYKQIKNLDSIVKVLESSFNGKEADDEALCRMWDETNI